MLITVPVKYIPTGLKKKDKEIIKTELKKSIDNYKKTKYHTRKNIQSFNSKTSKHIQKARQMYKTLKITSSSYLAKKTGCSLEGLRKIEKKGMGAYYSSGSRPNQTAISWGKARLASAITGGKSAAVDFHIIRRECSKSGKAYKEALKAKKKHGYGRRKVPKIVI
jgi:hypothetical protein